VLSIFYELSEDLLITINGNTFISQYSTTYKIYEKDQDFVWKTIDQILTLDKTRYSKGDEIKGKIGFKCIETNPNSNSENVKNNLGFRFN